MRSGTRADNFADNEMASRADHAILHNGVYRMQVKVDLPEDIANSLIAGGRDLGRTTSESLALEGYRTGRLSEETGCGASSDLNRGFRFTVF